MLRGMTRLYIVILGICALLLLASCTRTVYVPTERVTLRTDTVYSAKVRVDSVLLHDSVIVVQRGDTVAVTRYRDRYRVREMRDTVYQSVVDSVMVREPVEVERELTRWEKAKMDVGGWAIGGIAIAICVAVIWIIRLKRRKS